MHKQDESLQELRHIKSLMERSTRFVSLSGLSGIAAGIWALAGAFYADKMIRSYYSDYNAYGYSNESFDKLKWNLLLLSGIVLLLALVSAFIFTNRRAKSDKVSLFSPASQRLAINLLIPLVTGAFFILGMLRYDEWRFVAPLALIFYGLAVVNASKYTLTDIRYLGLAEIVLGLISTQFIGYGLYFWAAGFGILHIIYGTIMWFKYERRS